MVFVTTSDMSSLLLNQVLWSLEAARSTLGGGPELDYNRVVMQSSAADLANAAKRPGSASEGRRRHAESSGGAQTAAMEAGILAGATAGLDALEDAAPTEAVMSVRSQSYTIPAAQWRDQASHQVSIILSWKETTLNIREYSSLLVLAEEHHLIAFIEACFTSSCLSELSDFARTGVQFPFPVASRFLSIIAYGQPFRHLSTWCSYQRIGVAGW